jgi:hypothetical protein
MSLRGRFRVGMKVTYDGKPARVVQFSPGGNYVHVALDGHTGAHAVNEVEARKRILVPGEDPVLVKLTDKERELYVRIKHGHALFVQGVDVRTARRLARCGVIKLTDNGFMQREIGRQRSDGERWQVEIPTEMMR